MSKQQKTYLYIAIAVILIIGIVAAVFYFKGKKQVTLQYTPGELPGSTGTNYGASNDEIKTIAQSMYDDMNGLNLLGHNMDSYKRALVLNDADLIKLYNAFNIAYQSEGEGTLYEWIDDEKFSDNTVTDTLLNKMAKLNLK